MNHIQSPYPFPEKYQFKNAIHVGYSDSEKILISSSSKLNLRKDSNTPPSRDRRLEISPSKTSIYQQSKSGKIRKNLKDIGVTIDDEGTLLIAEWNNNKIEGQYFLFKQQLNRTNSQCFCLYGKMQGSRLSGQNYFCNSSKKIAKASFKDNCIDEKCYLFNKQNNQCMSDQKNCLVDCQVIKIDGQKRIDKRNQQNEKFKISNLNLKKNQLNSNQEFFLNNRKKSEQTQIDIPQFFLKKIAQKNIKYKNEQKSYFGCIYMSEEQCFFGFIQPNNTHKNISQNNESKFTKKISGFGVVLYCGWPNRYGQFVNGQLQGLCRKYQSEFKCLDGYFIKDQLFEGFIIDYKNKQQHFGHHIALLQDKPQKDQFVITDTIDLNDLQQLIQYKKIHHLKSLHYNGSYFNYPSLCNNSPWPLYISEILQSRKHIKKIIQNFDPNIQLSSIEDIIPTTQGRFQKSLIMKLNIDEAPDQEEEVIYKNNNIQNKHIKEKHQIYRKSKNQKQTHQKSRFSNNNKHVQSRRKQIQQYSKSKKSQKNTPYYHLEQLKTNKEIERLVHQYHQYQNQRYNLKMNRSTKHKNSGNQFNRPLESKRKMIDEDHLVFYQPIPQRNNYTQIQRQKNTNHIQNLDCNYLKK